MRLVEMRSRMVEAFTNWPLHKAVAVVVLVLASVYWVTRPGFGDFVNAVGCLIEWPFARC
jgi:hypothetical protein